MCEDPQGTTTDSGETTTSNYCDDTRIANLIIGFEGFIESEKHLLFSEMRQADKVGDVVCAVTKFLHRLLKQFGPFVSQCKDHYHEVAKGKLDTAVEIGGYKELSTIGDTEDYFCIYTGTYVDSKDDCKPIMD